MAYDILVRTGKWGLTPFSAKAPVPAAHDHDLRVARLEAGVGDGGEDVLAARRVLRPGNTASEPLRAESSERVAQAMGKALKPEKVLFTRDLPKTRSAKIMRRVIRATYLGKPAGEVSSLENPDAVRAIGEAT